MTPTTEPPRPVTVGDEVVILDDRFVIVRIDERGIATVGSVGPVLPIEVLGWDPFACAWRLVR